MGEIAYATIGREVSGDPAILRAAIEDQWRATAELVRVRLGVDLDARIIQAKGGASTSAGTHTDGVAVDIRVWFLTVAEIVAVVALLRECGWSATWFRDWTGNRHIHAVSDLGVRTKASYQVDAVKRGRDGLATNGRDPHEPPSSWRNNITGAAWARAQLAPPPREGILAMSSINSYNYNGPQPLTPRANRYLAATREGYWRTFAGVGPVMINVDGYATTKGAADATIWIKAENDQSKTSRTLGRVPLNLVTGYGSFSGSAVGILNPGESIRLQASCGGAPITITNLSTTVLHD